MINYDYFEGKIEAYKEFKDYIEFMHQNELIKKDTYTTTLEHLDKLIGIFRMQQELHLDDMRRSTFE